jgi:hypothetical protein
MGCKDQGGEHDKIFDGVRVRLHQAYRPRRLRLWMLRVTHCIIDTSRRPVSAVTYTRYKSSVFIGLLPFVYVTSLMLLRQVGTQGCKAEEGSAFRLMNILY